MIERADGQSITATYLHDIEQEHRSPPRDAIIEQLASVLEIPRDVLYYYAGRIPPELRNGDHHPETLVQAFGELRRVLAGEQPSRASDSPRMPRTHSKELTAPG